LLLTTEAELEPFAAAALQAGLERAARCVERVGAMPLTIRPAATSA